MWPETCWISSVFKYLMLTRSAPTFHYRFRFSLDSHSLIACSANSYAGCSRSSAARLSDMINLGDK